VPCAFPVSRVGKLIDFKVNVAVLLSLMLLMDVLS